MKATIDGITYNTEDQATEWVASRDCPSEAVNQLRYWQEDLYRTEQGEWFLAGEGGPLTIWGVFHQDSSDCDSGDIGYGAGILPLGPDQASLWLQEAGDANAWRHFFGRSKLGHTKAPTVFSRPHEAALDEPKVAKPRKSSRAVIKEAREAKAKAKKREKAKAKKAKAKKAKDTKAVKTLRKASNRALLLAKRHKD